jgi:chromosome partitioning protein
VVDLDPHADATTALGVQPGDQLDIGRMLKNARRAKLAENVVGSSWTALAQSNGSGPAVLDVAVGSAYTGIYDRPDLGRRDLRRLSTVLAGADDYQLVLIDCPPSLNGLTRMAWSASDKVALVAEPGCSPWPVPSGPCGPSSFSGRSLRPTFPRRHCRQPGAVRLLRAQLPAG